MGAKQPLTCASTGRHTYPSLRVARWGVRWVGGWGARWADSHFRQTPQKNTPAISKGDGDHRIGGCENLTRTSPPRWFGTFLGNRDRTRPEPQPTSSGGHHRATPGHGPSLTSTPRAALPANRPPTPPRHARHSRTPIPRNRATAGQFGRSTAILDAAAGRMSAPTTPGPPNWPASHGPTPPEHHAQRPAGTAQHSAGTPAPVAPSPLRVAATPTRPAVPDTPATLHKQPSDAGSSPPPPAPETRPSHAQPTPHRHNRDHSHHSHHARPGPGPAGHHVTTDLASPAIPDDASHHGT
ncbi:hypothetical protein CcI6DRAFT_02321 [Frankia sp. CcI6]|nr:hypothetical protein CcI6DRAFT_02321 [Frankia sp. CcI6]KFB05963.1 hypothetical protein ALLO2DRAFT_01248 [Frankia sp. Allo2]OAA28906.1 hypothetical protein AAY23_101871 [Frankia casuarinae]